MKRTIISCLALLLVCAGVAYASTIVGTNGNEWSGDKHPNHRLPDDCGGKEKLGDLGGKPSSDVISGRGGCDYIYGKEGNDIIYGGLEMDFIYGGPGNDKIIGMDGHDHLFGGSGPGGPSGNDILDARDGRNEAGNIEEVHGSSGTDRCFLDPDPDGVKFSSCEYLNGRKHPFGNDFVNTSDEGSKGWQARRGEVNNFLSRS